MLQRKLVDFLVQEERLFFRNLFEDEFGTFISNDVINNILSQIEVECLRPGNPVIKAGDEVNYFYMIKKGDVKVFDKGYNFLYILTEGSFFGEYNIIFGLYSAFNYVPILREDQAKEKYAMIFKIEGQ